MTCQIQTYPTPAIWQPGVFQDQPSAQYLAFDAGLLHRWQLVEYDPGGNKISVTDLAVNPYPLTNFRAVYSSSTFGGTDGGFAGSAYFDGSAYMRVFGSDVSFGLSFGCAIFLWVKLESKTQDMVIFEYKNLNYSSILSIVYLSILDRFKLSLSTPQGDVELPANAFGSPSVGTWYGIYVEVANGQCLIRIGTRGVAPTYLEQIGGVWNVTFPYGRPTQALPVADAIPASRITSTGGLGSFEIGKYLRGNVSGVCVWGRPLNYLEQSEMFYNQMNVTRFWPAESITLGNDFSAAFPGPHNFALYGEDPSWMLNWINANGWAEIEVWRDNGTGRHELLDTLDPQTSSYEITADPTPYAWKVRHLRPRGGPSAFTEIGTYYRSNGRIFLKSDDASWYSLGLAMDPDTWQTTLDIDQTPVAAPPYGAEFLNIQADTRIKVSLVTVDGLVTYEVGQVDSGTADGLVTVLNLASDIPGRFHALTIDKTNGIYAVQIDQIAIGQPDAVVLNAPINSDSLITIYWPDPVSTATFYQVEYRTSSTEPVEGAWTRWPQEPLWGTNEVTFDSGGLLHDFAQIRIRAVLGSVYGPWSNVQQLQLLFTPDIVVMTSVQQTLNSLITAYWDPPLSTANFYQIQYRCGPIQPLQGGWGSAPSDPVWPAQSLEWDSAASDGDFVQVRIRAVLDSLPGDWSEIVEIQLTFT